MIIKVLREHIFRGWQNNCYLCPIALAIRSATGFSYMVTPTEVCLEDAQPRLWIQLPIEARQFIDAFDRGKSVEPFEFELSLEEGEPCTSS